MPPLASYCHFPLGALARPLHVTASVLDAQVLPLLPADQVLRFRLALRRAQCPAPARLRHLLGEREASAGLPHHAGGGRESRSPAPRAGDGPLPPEGGGRRIGVLAPEGLDALPPGDRKSTRLNSRP